ncbi:MAG TPA: hypothetical protein VKP59_07420 [Candidatus Thermoplasmatota archaeon]|nr:hypothetical protein [Candidatus Thermoplasmatota archaeon]
MNNHKEHRHDEMPDPEKIKEILDVVADRVPGLLRELSSLLYSPESAKQYAQAAAIFYKELKNAGMSESEAYELTSQYLSTLNLGKMMRNFTPRHED